MQSDNSSNIVFGNAGLDGANRRGWFIGHFIEAHSACQTAEVEVKWGVHEAGQERDQWSTNRTATTLSILIHGRFRLFFPEHEILLAEVGDYALWLPGVPHTWVAETVSTVLTLRFPSVSEDTIELEKIDLCL